LLIHQLIAGIKLFTLFSDDGTQFLSVARSRLRYASVEWYDCTASLPLHAYKLKTV